MREIKYIVLHCTAGPMGQRIEDIQAYWKKLGWKRPGYHHLITADGTCNDLQRTLEPTNGVAGYNAHAIHISYAGGVGKDGRPADTRTAAQRATMEALVRKYRALYPRARILGHRDFSPDKNRDGVIQPGEWMKACPSFSVSEWLRETGISPTAAPPVVRRVVQSRNGGAVNIRTGPGLQYGPAADPLPPGTAAIVLSEKDGWAAVSISDKLSGWIRKDFLAE